MPPNFLPRNSGAHRIACKALYRSLLLQTRFIPLPPSLPSQGVTNPLTHLIRKQFRRYVDCTSAKILVKVLGRGYEAERLLRTAVQAGGNEQGGEEALGKIHAFLQTLHNQREAARKACTPRPPHSSLPLKKQRPRVWPYPDAPKLLDVRPLPVEKLSGRRGLPKLAAANGVPFLRIKKPQSAFLGRVLRDKAGQKARRFDRLRECEEGVDAGKAEEEWEELLENVGRFREGDGNEGRFRGNKGEQGWAEDVERERWEVHRVAVGEQRKWLEMGRVMAGVQEVERELWVKERGEGRQKKLEDKKGRNGWVERGVYDKAVGKRVVETDLSEGERARYTPL